MAYDTRVLRMSNRRPKGRGDCSQLLVGSVSSGERAGVRVLHGHPAPIVPRLPVYPEF